MRSVPLHRVRGERPPADVLWASAECREGPRPAGVFHDEFNEITIGNGAESPVRVAHIGSLTGPDQPGIPEFTLAPGETYRGLLARAIPDGEAIHGAVVTSDQGVLRLPCGDTGVPIRAQLIPPDDLEEQAATMARTLSLLESYWQFDALFALLHPDVRQVISYNPFACWYFNYVRTERPAGEATVTAVRIGPWTWPVTGKRYAEAAAVTYRQPYWVEGAQETEEREATLIWSGPTTPGAGSSAWTSPGSANCRRRANHELL